MMFLLPTNCNICHHLIFKYLVPWSRDRARPHRIDGRHGMATMAWHAWLRIDARGAGAADLIQNCGLSDYCRAEGRRGPKSKVPEDTNLLAQVILWCLKELLMN